jgi:hypothetical protein
MIHVKVARFSVVVLSVNKGDTCVPADKDDVE